MRPYPFRSNSNKFLI